MREVVQSAPSSYADSDTSVRAAPPPRPGVAGTARGSALDRVIAASQRYLLGLQHGGAGYWCSEIGADTTLVADFVMFRRLLGDVDRLLERRALRDIIDRQQTDGGWNIYAGGPSELNASVKAYFALIELKDRFGLDFIGVQDQLDWVEHLPTTDLTLGLLNNRLRPEADGETIVAATEADDGAAVTMQLLKLLSGGEPVGFNDFRYWDGRGLYWFVNSGSLAPFFASGRNDSLAGSWSERQTDIYFKEGGGTCSVVVRVPGVVGFIGHHLKAARLGQLPGGPRRAGSKLGAFKDNRDCSQIG